MFYIYDEQATKILTQSTESSLRLPMYSISEVITIL